MELDCWSYSQIEYLSAIAFQKPKKIKNKKIRHFISSGSSLGKVLSTTVAKKQLLIYIYILVEMKFDAFQGIANYIFQYEFLA